MSSDPYEEVFAHWGPVHATLRVSRCTCGGRQGRLGRLRYLEDGVKRHDAFEVTAMSSEHGALTYLALAETSSSLCLLTTFTSLDATVLMSL